MISINIFGTNREVPLKAVCSLNKLVVLLIGNAKVEDGVATLWAYLQGTQIETYRITVLPQFHVIIG